MRNNKKAFTLIEIIVAVVLVSLISAGGVFSFNYYKQQKVKKTLSTMSPDIRLAASVYIETNDETKKQLYEKNNGVIIPLVTLEKEGLIDFEGLNVDNEYIVTLLSREEDCMEPSVIESWDFSSGKILYICTKTDNQEKIEELEKSINSLKVELNNIREENVRNYFDNNNKGANAKNWVKFDVTSDTTKWVWWPNDADEDLWHIHSIDDEGRIRLVYNKPVGTDNSKNIKSGTIKSNGYYELLHNDVNYGEYNLYDSNTIWTYRSVVNEDVNTEGSRKQILYNNINNKNWIVTASYNPTYTNELNLVYSSSNYIMGMLSSDDVSKSILNGSSWIGNYSFLVGTYSRLGDTYIVYISNYSKRQSSAYSRTSKGNYRVYGSNYIPVITLDSKVKISSYENCANGKVRGTKECPYELYKSA